MGIVRLLATAIVVALATAVATVAVQRALFGEVNPTVTGGVAGAVSAVIVSSLFRRRSE